ncbi:30S ribosomal protein S20 [Lactovum miscens]|uniref:Small ribosomal subunit protein bS20 n=1 Tax=Lactovum miscens TaxID=190387 RepID=A0A841CB85_9LACT|nr:30S ribosomal protein S20 [Lactovum miscens]MBB5888440.1 small subunit ribosomal protein S20 [Lactovum miscens]
MANIKSSIKRAELNNAQNERNSAQRAGMRTAVKKFEADPTSENFKAASSAIDSAKSKGLIKANKASRDKSRLSSKLA